MSPQSRTVIGGKSITHQMVGSQQGNEGRVVCAATVDDNGSIDVLRLFSRIRARGLPRCGQARLLVSESISQVCTSSCCSIMCGERRLVRLDGHRNFPNVIHVALPGMIGASFLQIEA